MVDTSTFFSAIYNRKGNEAYLFELADKGLCSIYIVDYVLEEMKEVFKRKKFYQKFTLTYFIPSPPTRKTGYREKEFDEIIYNLLQDDYELIDIKTQNAVGPDHNGGMWVICIVGALTKQAAEAHLSIEDRYGLKIVNESPDLEIEYE